MAAVRYLWMFRTAAVVFALLGVSWLYTFALTDLHAAQRPYGLAAGVLALIVSFFLFRRRRIKVECFPRNLHGSLKQQSFACFDVTDR